MASRKKPSPLSATSAKKFFPEQLSLPSLKAAAADCKACDLWEKGTQTVFGEGRSRATFLFVGEQPGNEEDLTGKPFVGPAGRLFDEPWKKPASIANKPTSRMLSNISNGSHGQTSDSQKTKRRRNLSVSSLARS